MKKRYVVTASAFDSKGRVICTRQNNYLKTHPLQKHFAKLAGEEYKESLHAEIACLVASRDIEVSKLVILRYNAEGALKLAKPCRTCQTALMAYGVEDIYYSTENEGIVRL